MRKFLVAFCFAGLGIAGFLATQSRGQQTEGELRALVPKIVASWETMDFAKIEPYYAADADLAYFDLAPRKARQGLDRRP